MKRSLSLLLLVLISASTFAQKRAPIHVNFGVKTGFSSTIYEIQELIVAHQPINEYMVHSEISSFYTGFARFNIKRHYLQTEISYNISNYTLSFDSDQWLLGSPTADQSAISTRIIGLEIPFYYGYHFMQESSYGMSFFIGPKAKLILTDYSRHKFDKMPYTNIEESIYPVNFSLMVGIGISISPVFFDFSFEYGLHNISRGFTATDTDGLVTTDALIFNRRKNVLSFSIGFMF